MLLVDNEQPDIDEDDGALNEDDIEIPKSDLIDDDNSEIKAEGGEQELEQDSNIKKDIKSLDIKIAIPKDKSSPYDNQWIEIIRDEDFEMIGLNDYDILGFKFIEDDDIKIIEAAYDE